MRICVYGAGAMGTSLGVLLTRAHISCDLVSRNRAHVDALKQNGAVLLSARAETVTEVSALLPAEMKRRYDVVFLATGQRENRQIACFLKGHLAYGGALVSVQNGLPEKTLADVVGADAVYGAALSWGAERVGAGKVRVTSESGFHVALGAYGKGRRLEELAALLERCAFVTVGNLTEIRFAKLAINASFSTLSALSGLTFGEIAAKYRRYAMLLMRETFAVARAAGCKKLPLNGHDLFRVFAPPFGGLLLPFAMKKYKNTRSGMLLSLERGEPCDADFISGAVVRAAESLGIGAPCLARATARIHYIEAGRAPVSEENFRIFER